MARLLGFLLIVALAVLGITFAMLNANPVTLNYYFGQIDLPLSLVVVGALVAGALTGALVSLGALLRLKQTTARLRRQLHTAQRDAERIAILPADD